MKRAKWKDRPTQVGRAALWAFLGCLALGALVILTAVL